MQHRRSVEAKRRRQQQRLLVQRIHQHYEQPEHDAEQLLKQQEERAQDLLYTFCFIDRTYIRGEKVFTVDTKQFMHDGMKEEFGMYPVHLVNRYDCGEVLNSHTNFAGL